MFRFSLTGVFIIALVLMTIQSCNKNETKISQANGTHSHNMGRNCMGCHYSGGEGDGWFTVAGTAYSAVDSGLFKNPVMQLWTMPNGRGQIVSTVYGDANGNFYTTAATAFGTGLYPSVTGSTGTRYMGTPITQGACNSCHGVTTTKIITK